MQITAESIELIKDVEYFAQRKFQYFEHLTRLLDSANQKDNRAEFDELIFLSKFVANSWNILDRVGGESQETEKIKMEFTDNLQKTQALISDLTRGDMLFSDFREITTPDAFQRFRAFVYELSWLQNYYIDRKAKR